MQLEAGELPAAGLRLKAQHGCRCGPGRTRWDPQRRELVIPGNRLHGRDFARWMPIGHPAGPRITVSVYPGLPGGHSGRHDEQAETPAKEDDVSEPGMPTEVPDADRAEQEALLDPPAVATAGDATPPPVDVPEADALEQQLAARPGETGSPLRPLGDREADEADILEQEEDVPLDDDDVVS